MYATLPCKRRGCFPSLNLPPGCNGETLHFMLWYISCSTRPQKFKLLGIGFTMNIRHSTHQYSASCVAKNMWRVKHAKDNTIITRWVTEF